MAKDAKKKKHFFKDFKAELKKVVWPTPKQLVNNTIAVIVIVLITSAIVFVLDLAFDAMNKFGINKLKTQIKSNTTNNVESQNVVSNTTDGTTATATIDGKADTTEVKEATK